MIDLRDTLQMCFIDVTESPIERMLLSAISMGIGALKIRGYDLHGHSLIKRINPQFKYKNYRIDIAIFGESYKLAIECNGHDFHEKTKEQATKDKKRARELINDGWILIEFTGSEIYANPFICALEIMDTITSLELKNNNI